MAYADLHELGSETAVKAAGKLRQQGRTYESTWLTVSAVVHTLIVVVQWSMATSPTGSRDKLPPGRVRHVQK